jgi:hypothetical protein
MDPKPTSVSGSSLDTSQASVAYLVQRPLNQL